MNDTKYSEHINYTSNITKAELVSRISEQTGIDKSTAFEVVENLMEQVRNSLIEGKTAYLRGFGTLGKAITSLLSL